MLSVFLSKLGPVRGTRHPFMLSRMTALYVVIGIVGGTIAAFYWLILSALTEQLGHGSGLWVVGIMVGAGLLLGLCIHFLGEPGEISLVIDNIRFRGGRLDPKNNASMLLASLVGISSGGSAGPEAPLVQMTGSLGTWIADRLRLTGEELRSVTIAGMAAGFTSLFGSPLGGALFALEILQHRHIVEYYEALLPAFISSCSAFLVFVAVTHIGLGPTWKFPQYAAVDIWDFASAIGLGVVGACIGWLFYGIFRVTRKVFEVVPGPIYVRTTVGGLLLGVLAFYEPLTRYFGHNELEDLVTADRTMVALVLLLLLKLLAISVTISSGWRGGIIIPLFFVGAVAGQVLLILAPSSRGGLYLICLMAGVNAAVTKTPISTTILLADLTGVGNLTAVLFASITGYFLSPRVPFIVAQGPK